MDTSSIERTRHAAVITWAGFWAIAGLEFARQGLYRVTQPDRVSWTFGPNEFWFGLAMASVSFMVIGLEAWSYIRREWSDAE